MKLTIKNLIKFCWLIPVFGEKQEQPPVPEQTAVPAPLPPEPAVMSAKLFLSSQFSQDLGTQRHLLLIKTCYKVKAYLRRFLIEADLMVINHQNLFAEFNRIFYTPDPDSNGKIIRFNAYNIVVFMLTFIETLKLGLSGEVVEYNLIKMAKICNRIIKLHGNKMPAFSPRTLLDISLFFVF